ncbi:MAG: hypothetical protein KME03_09060 [Aphanocapsa lilacina HA4352-LM1]|jgi:hypothetical protein|uniref:Glr4396 protein n=2 Tax=Gloeobacter TaxID=33071 RepID=Q7ND40_GLOVI|nr:MULTISPECIES: hypothetical protein [Gloeobacter]MBW4698028.1 hypothetical protein [Aphanocapsa lilacina HA4352-LM1]UFP92561.1 hypothetical protein ISF26_11960 [Gloeobacter morelensis MG652769]BAC92337.1 glr4396 [Gloeobacter violaceus PCC 7421]
MDLQEALEKIWESQRYQTKSPLEALKYLQQEVLEAQLAWLRSNPDKARQKICEALPRLLVTMRLLGLDPQGVLEQKAAGATQRQRIMYIIGNRVEVRVGDELRGSWTIWSEEDLREVHNLAREFECILVHTPPEDANSYQVGFFNSGGNGSSYPSSKASG